MITHLDAVVIGNHVAVPDFGEQSLAGCVSNEHLVVGFNGQRDGGRVAKVGQASSQKKLRAVFILFIAQRKYSDCQGLKVATV